MLIKSKISGITVLILSLLILYPLSVLSDVRLSTNALKALENKVKQYTLDNGLRVILYKRDFAPVFAGVVSVRVGGVDEHPGNTGISHILEHMAFKGTTEIGTKNYSREKDLLNELEAIARASAGGTKFSAEQKIRWDQIQSELEEFWDTEAFTRHYRERGSSGLNATTSKELTSYFVNLPKNSFEFWAWMESERLYRPVMRQFYQERDVVMEERRMRYDDDPNGALYEQLLATAYLQHPYRYPVIGYPADISKVTATETAEFHKTFYSPERIVVSVVGDLEPETAIKTIKKYFGRLPKTSSPAFTQIKEEEQQSERSFVIRRDASPSLVVAYHKPNFPDPDDAAITLMLELLAGSSVSPVYDQLVKRKQIAASIEFDEGPGTAYPNLVMFFMAVKNPHSNKTLLKMFDREVEKFKMKGPTQQELDNAKRAIAVDYLVHLKSNMSLAKNFASSELIYNNWKALVDWYEEAMKVEIEDVTRVANKYLDSKSRTVGYLEPLK
ncbi:MAG: pitrilysin family protein [Bdellovibrionota bacterium]